MKLLVMKGHIVGIAENITFGIYDEDIEKWRLADENDNLMHYMIDSDFELVEDVTLPDDYEGGKYFYENGEFVLNEDWKPYVSTEERISILEEENVKLNEAINGIWDDIAISISTGVNEV